MNYAYIIVLRGDVKPRRWWSLPREASAFSEGTTEPMPGVTRSDVMAALVQMMRDRHPHLMNTYVEYFYLAPDDVLVPVPEQPPMVDTGVITAVTEDGDLHVSGSRPRLDLENDTQMFTPVVARGTRSVSVGGDVVNSAISVGNV
jgi:hypothetical protein